MAREGISPTIQPTIMRRTLLGGLAGAVALTAAPAVASAPALLRGAGNFRGLDMVNPRTGEWVKSVYWIEGEYIPEVLQAVNWIMRDWREDVMHVIDPRTIDILSATHRLLDCREPLHVLSGYRCPKTNAELRRKSNGVAKNSFHIKGMAADVMMKTRSVSQICRAGLSLRAGGVGRYSRSDFVHLDSGPVRDWGR